MLTLTNTTLLDLLYSLEPNQYLMREPWRDGPPIYLDVEQMIHDAQCGACKSDPIWEGPIVAQYSDQRDRILVAGIQRKDDDEGFTIVKDTRHLIIIRKDAAIKDLNLDAASKGWIF